MTASDPRAEHEPPAAGPTRAPDGAPRPATEAGASEVGASDPALLSALVTEHFVLQSVRSTTTAEATSRASLYLATLSSAMIALGFVSGQRSTLHAFLVAVLPVVIILGVVTFLRLVDLGIQDLRRLQDIERVKDYYRAMPAPAADYFPPVAWRDARTLIASQNMRAGPTQLLSTSAAMVGLINSAVIGIGAALLVATAVALAVAAALGTVVGVGVLVVALRYQWRMNLRAFS